MKVNKIFIGINALCFILFLCHPTKAFATYISRSETTLTTTVPETHTLQLKIGEHGFIDIDGIIYTDSQTIQIQRSKIQEYKIIPDNGYFIESVIYDGKNVTEEVKNSLYIAPAINSDNGLMVINFTKAHVDDELQKEHDKDNVNTDDSYTKGASVQGNVKTGDSSHISLWGILLLVSVISLLYIEKKRKNV